GRQDRPAEVAPDVHREPVWGQLAEEPDELADESGDPVGHIRRWHEAPDPQVAEHLPGRCHLARLEHGRPLGTHADAFWTGHDRLAGPLGRYELRCEQ